MISPDPENPSGPDIIYPAGKNIAILRDGVVIPVGPRNLSPNEIVAQIKDVVLRPYTGDNPALWGKSLFEAMLVTMAQMAADGDLDAAGKILDRLLGKPLQQTVTATGTLKEFLSEIASDDARRESGTDPLAD
jgi:hypothetical protein